MEPDGKRRLTWYPASDLELLYKGGGRLTHGASGCAGPTPRPADRADSRESPPSA